MKRLFKALWRLTLPVRRPFQAKAEGFVAGCVARALEAHDPTRALAADVNLVLDAVLAEHFRLQAQVEELQRLVHEGLAPREEAAGASRDA
jgi:hypothetical protein